jgi:hypothetical protein
MQVKVVILGQDPYHGPGQAHGLPSRCQDGVKVPPSLVNIYKELEAISACRARARQSDALGAAGRAAAQQHADGRTGQPGSHQGLGWEAITDAAVAAVAAKAEPCVFLLWGSHARKKALSVPGLMDDGGTWSLPRRIPARFRPIRASWLAARPRLSARPMPFSMPAKCRWWPVPPMPTG